MFQTRCLHEEAVRRIADDALLEALFPEAKIRIVERKGARRTIESDYEVLGRPGMATFHFDTGDNGDIHFQKICDGRVWRELVGSLLLEATGAGTEVRIELEGRTKTLVPELAIRVPMEDQLAQMSQALEQWLDR